MMRLSSALALTAAMALLAACERSADAPADTLEEPVDETEGAAAEPGAPIAAGLAHDDLIGVWDASAEMCGAQTSLERITVTASEIRFWESGGLITDSSIGREGQVLIEAAMEGEGETWTAGYVFNLAADGQSFDALIGDAPVQIARVRCD